MTTSGIQQMLKRHDRQAGANLHPHRFRHQFAHEWLQSRGSETDLTNIAGWKPYDRVQRYARYAAHTSGANSSHVGVLIMLGGSQKPTKNQLKGFREFRAWLGKRGVSAGNVNPHSRWASTSCPGSHLRSRVSNNNWGSGGSISTEEDPVIGLSKGDTGEAVKALQALITYAGGSLPRYGVDGDYGAETVEGLRQVRASVGSEAGAGWGDQVTGYGYAQLMRAVARAE